MKTPRPLALGGLAAVASMCLALAACGQPESGAGSARSDDTGTAAEQAANPAAIAAAKAETARMEAAARAKAEAGERIERARAQRLARIEEIRRKDPALNWVNVGISTGKFSESINTTVYRTYDECERDPFMETSSCFPIARLPESYWKAEEQLRP